MVGFFKKEETQSLKIVGGKKLSCFSCGLYKDVQSPKMEPYGNFKKRVMVIGEAPGEREDHNGKPWQGKTGRLLQKTLEEIGIDLFDDCISLNAVNCRPPDNRSPSPNEINCCRDVKVLKAIDEYKPVMVLLLGGVALTSVIGVRWKSTKLGGIMKWAGRCIPDQQHKMWICPTFHPSYVERMDSKEVSVVWGNDLKEAFRRTKGALPIYKEPKIHYIEDLEWLRQINTDMASFDYETTGIKPHSLGHRIVCASIAYSPDEVVAFMMPPKKKDRIPFIEFLQSDIKKIASNLKFETQWSNVRLGVDVNNWVHDTMLEAHIIDHRPGTTSLKFQTYANFGVVGYDDEVSYYLQSADNKSNSINRIYKLLEKPGGKEELLKYCALDSYFEYLLAQVQIKEMNELIKRS